MGKGITLQLDERCFSCAFYNSKYDLCELPACDKVKGLCDIYREQFLKYQKLHLAACYGDSVTK